MVLNQDILNIEDSNEFYTASKLVKEYKEKNPDKKVVSLGIGDVSKPIIKPVIEAMHKAVDDQAKMVTFKGYGPSHGYDFLKETILKNDYKNFSFSKEEIYISNGTKTDTTSILELFSIDSKICIINPCYPIYKNGAQALNRKVYYITATEEDGFIAKIPEEHYDIIYLCNPNNPLGIAYDYEYLKDWVGYANNHKSVILYDNAYFNFITSNNVPTSIYEIEGAKNVAIEFRSFSKGISFTGIRCSFFVIPNQICDGINEAWKKRTINRFNGADYIAQRGAEAAYLPESQKIIKDNISNYMRNVNILKDFFISLGLTVYGGTDSPFLWMKIKEQMTSWELFDFYLKELNVVITPGIIFGKEGDGFIRISGLASNEVITEAIERLRKHYEK